MKRRQVEEGENGRDLATIPQVLHRPRLTLALWWVAACSGPVGRIGRGRTHSPEAGSTVTHPITSVDAVFEKKTETVFEVDLVKTALEFPQTSFRKQSREEREEVR